MFNILDNSIGSSLDIQDIDQTALWKMFKDPDKIKSGFTKHAQQKYVQGMTKLQFLNKNARIFPNVKTPKSMTVIHFEYLMGVPVIVLSSAQWKLLSGLDNTIGIRCSHGIVVVETKTGCNTLTHEFIHAVVDYLKEIGIFASKPKQSNFDTRVELLRNESLAYLLSSPGKIASFDLETACKALLDYPLDSLKMSGDEGSILINLVKIVRIIDSDKPGVSRINFLRLCLLKSDPLELSRELVTIIKS